MSKVQNDNPSWWEGEVELSDETQPITEVDLALEIAEAKRVELIENFSDLGFQQAHLAAGAISNKAHWTWTFLLRAEKTYLTTVTIDLISDGTCYFKSEVNVDGTGYLLEGVAKELLEAPDLAFDALYTLYAKVGETR